MNEMLDRLIPLFEKLAEKIGAGAAFSWEVVLRQQQVYAVQYFIVAIFAGALTTAIGVIALPRVRAIKDSNERTGFTLITCVVMTFGAGVTLAFMCGAISRLINPEFYAVSWLLDRVR